MLLTLLCKNGDYTLEAMITLPAQDSYTEAGKECRMHECGEW